MYITVLELSTSRCLRSKHRVCLTKRFLLQIRQREDSLWDQWLIIISYYQSKVIAEYTLQSMSQARVDVFEGKQRVCSTKRFHLPIRQREDSLHRIPFSQQFYSLSVYLCFRAESVGCFWSPWYSNFQGRCIFPVGCLLSRARPWACQLEVH